eukprot:scaffold48037_cov69-Phaeocystis_antarctica.AAC.1
MFTCSAGLDCLRPISLGVHWPCRARWLPSSYRPKVLALSGYPTLPSPGLLPIPSCRPTTSTKTPKYKGAWSLAAGSANLAPRKEACLGSEVRP